MLGFKPNLHFFFPISISVNRRKEVDIGGAVVIGTAYAFDDGIVMDEERLAKGIFSNDLPHCNPICHPIPQTRVCGRIQYSPSDKSPLPLRVDLLCQYGAAG